MGKLIIWGKNGQTRTVATWMFGACKDGESLAYFGATRYKKAAIKAYKMFGSQMASATGRVSVWTNISLKRMKRM